MKRLHQLLHPNEMPSTRRGWPRQFAIREREYTLRNQVAELTRWTRVVGLSLPETAERLHLAPRTLRHWCKGLRSDSPRILALGRPTLRSDRAQRMEVLAVLDELGPATSVATLRDGFPCLSRAELEDLLKRYRRVWQKRHQHAPHLLEWTVPGSVWAMDFTYAPQALDAQYPYLLAVRDLASSYQMLWLPVPSMSADEVIPALRSLFCRHGAPLVLKTDNGPAFIAEETQEFLRQLRVSSLFSPPQTPRYNGSIEAGIGSLKMRMERYAAHYGRPNLWTHDDAAHAQAEANATARPKGPNGPTPDRLWNERRPLTAEQRNVFEDAVVRHQKEVYTREGIPCAAEGNPFDQRRLNRDAIRRALGEHDYLLFSRRRIPLPINSHKSANIS